MQKNKQNAKFFQKKFFFQIFHLSTIIFALSVFVLVVSSHHYLSWLSPFPSLALRRCWPKNNARNYIIYFSSLRFSSSRAKFWCCLLFILNFRNFLPRRSHPHTHANPSIQKIAFSPPLKITSPVNFSVLHCVIFKKLSIILWYNRKKIQYFQHDISFLFKRRISMPYANRLLVTHTKIQPFLCCDNI